MSSARSVSSLRLDRETLTEVVGYPVGILRSQTPNLRDMAVPVAKTLTLTLQCFVICTNCFCFGKRILNLFLLVV